MLIETSGSNESHDTEKVSGFLECIMEEGLVEDGALAQDRKQGEKQHTLLLVVNSRTCCRPITTTPYTTTTTTTTTSTTTATTAATTTSKIKWYDTPPHALLLLLLLSPSAQEIWKLREQVPVVLEETGRVHKFDVSLPMNCFYDIVEDLRDR